MSPSCREVDVIKSPSSTTSWISNSPSPSSTLSESSNCPFAVSTRKPRTPRKRPNQTYNEAAAILSTAYPKIFPTKPSKFDRNCSSTFLFEPSELLMPFPLQELDSSEFLFDKPLFPIEIKSVNENPCVSPADIEFDAESILDEEMGEGIESIMGNLEMENEPIDNSFCIGYPVGMGMGMEVAYGVRRESRAMRNGDWWSNGNTSVNVIDLSKVCSASKKRKKEVEIESVPQLNGGPLLLKLDYDGIMDAWSDKDSPFPGDSPASESAGNDVRARLAQIDLFWDNGGVREASVQRYKEKRRKRLFSKKIRYEVRKVNADRRPRMKGRFVRTPDLEMQ